MFIFKAVHTELDTSSRLMMRWPVSRLKPSVLMSHPEMCLKWLKMLTLNRNTAPYPSAPLLTLRDDVVQNLD